MFKYGSFSYSCDKIKLKCRLKKYKGEIPHRSKVRTWVEFALPDNFECVGYNECLYSFKYRYAYELRVKESKEGVFHIREWYNGDFKEQKQKPEAVLIEFNPNKDGALIYKAFCNTFIFEILEVVSFDIAYDIPHASTKDVLLNTRADIMTYGKNTNRTLYIAPKEDKSGRVKCYDKDIERERLGIAKEKTLRIEATVKCSCLDFNNIFINGNLEKELLKTVEHLNSVNIKQATECVEDWKLYALLNLPSEELEKCLALMSRNIRTKYKQKLQEKGFYNLSLDIATFVTHISNILKPYTERIRIK